MSQSEIRFRKTRAKDAEFLTENAKKDDVVQTDIGLQYKVIKGQTDTSLPKPSIDTTCHLHYRGRLVDGTEFDSSYKRGKPSDFAPRQVIKGWTEAMQLMVEGDKWEMYIPYDLAYGEGGSPPKIPGKACLIFVMEIMKINGAKVPAKLDFPEWTQEQLALWQPKDEEAVNKWREAKEKSWAEGKLKEAYPTRELFEAWLDKQSLSSKNKSLWKRTRKNYEEEGEPPASAGPPKLTKETARSLLTRAIDTFKQPANKDNLEGLLKECEAMDPAQAPMMKMMKLMPAVQGESRDR